MKKLRNLIKVLTVTSIILWVEYTKFWLKGAYLSIMLAFVLGMSFLIGVIATVILSQVFGWEDGNRNLIYLCSFVVCPAYLGMAANGLKTYLNSIE